MTSKNVHTFELKMGKRALIMFIIGMSCLLFVVFLFGVTIGKNIDTYPEKYSRGIAGMFVEKFGLSSGRVETATGNPIEMPREYAKGVGEEKAGEEKKEPATAPVGTDEKPSEAATFKEQKPPVASAAEQATTKPSPVKERYQIQVISFKEKDKADKFCKQLADLGYKSRIAVTELREKGKWFRIIVEGFESREHAQKSVDSMSEKFKGLNCVIIRVGEKSN